MSAFAHVVARRVFVGRYNNSKDDAAGSERARNNRARAEEGSRLFEQTCEKLNLPVAPRALDSLTYKDFAECACADKLVRWRIGTS